MLKVKDEHQRLGMQIIQFLSFTGIVAALIMLGQYKEKVDNVIQREQKTESTVEYNQRSNANDHFELRTADAKQQQEITDLQRAK